MNNNAMRFIINLTHLRRMVADMEAPLERMQKLYGGLEMMVNDVTRLTWPQRIKAAFHLFRTGQPVAPPVYVWDGESRDLPHLPGYRRCDYSLELQGAIRSIATINGLMYGIGAGLEGRLPIPEDAEIAEILIGRTYGDIQRVIEARNSRTWRAGDPITCPKCEGSGREGGVGGLASCAFCNGNGVIS